MIKCMQTPTQNVLEHGIAVRNCLFDIINYLNGIELLKEYKLPEWLVQYKNNIKENLLSKDILELYTVYHDCGKPYCLQIDEQGNQHFINHANVSADKWLEIGGDKTVADLMRRDMEIHMLKAENIDIFCKDDKIAISLLLAGLAELHANSKLFGGLNSINFKIKYKKIDRRGKAICKKIFKNI